MVTGIPMPGLGIMVRGFAGMVAADARDFIGGKAARFMSGQAQGILAQAGYCAASLPFMAYDAYDFGVRRPVGAVFLPLTGGGINPLDLNNLVKAVPGLTTSAAIKALDAFSWVLDRTRS